MIDLSTASFIGPEITDVQILQILPPDYQEFLLSLNGGILFGGGLHVRGACESPDWHSIRRVWTGPDALSSFYTSVVAEDVPVAQEVGGDQFLLRGGLSSPER